MELIPVHVRTTMTTISYLFNETESSSPPSSDEAIDDEAGLAWSSARIKRITLLSIVMTLSLIGNSMIIMILTCSKTHKQLSRVNMFILNLAFGDLSVIWTIGSEIIYEVYGEWKLGNLGCKLIMYLQIVTLSSTTYILCVMSFSRYQAICRPLDYTPSPKKMIFAAWVAAFICALPYLFIFLQVQKGAHMECVSEGYTAAWQRRVNFIWLTSSVLIVPAIFISFCYFSLAKVVWQQGELQKIASNADGIVLRKHCDIRIIPRAKIKTLKMSLTIVISFIVSWSPYFIVYNILIFSDYEVQISKSILTLVETLALLNSVMNPMIYGCFNLRIRQGLREACCFNINVQSDKSQLSEPSHSTSSTIRIKAVRWTPDYQHRCQRSFSDGKSSFDFAQSTRHIQNKRSRACQSHSACRSHHRTLTQFNSMRILRKPSPENL